AGVLVWKSQNPWPSLRGQLYDWYLEPTGGLFGAQRACEPVHIQLSFGDPSNHHTLSVLVTNNTPEAFNNVVATATMYALDSTATLAGKVRKPLPESSVSKMFSLEHLPRAASIVYFLDLRLTDSFSTEISRNFYWLAPNDDYKALATLKPAHIEAT